MRFPLYLTLTYRCQNKALPNGESRHLVTHKKTSRPSLLGSLYESHLHFAARSHNTKSSALHILPNLLSYAEHMNMPLEARLLNGEPLLPAEMRGFAYWLEQRLLNDTNPHNRMKDGKEDTPTPYERQDGATLIRPSQSAVYPSQNARPSTTSSTPYKGSSVGQLRPTTRAASQA